MKKRHRDNTTLFGSINNNGDGVFEKCRMDAAGATASRFDRAEFGSSAQRKRYRNNRETGGRFAGGRRASWWHLGHSGGPDVGEEDRKWIPARGFKQTGVCFKRKSTSHSCVLHVTLQYDTFQCRPDQYRFLFNFSHTPEYRSILNKCLIIAVHRLPLAPVRALHGQIR